MSRSVRFLCWFGLAAAQSSAALSAFAADPNPVIARDSPLDEEALVRHALTHNLELRAARFQQGVADAAITRAGALDNPVARAEWLHVQTPDDYGFGVGLEWKPPQPGVYGAGKDAARFGAAAVREDLRERAAELEADVRRGCAELRTLDAELALAEQAVTTRRNLAEAVSRRVERGAANRMELSLVRVSLARAEQQREMLSLTRDSRRGELEVSLGLPAGQRLDLGLPPASDLSALENRASTTPPQTSDAELARRAVERRPALRADRQRVGAADRLLSAERAKRWPWLSIEGRYRRHDQARYPNDVTLGLELSLPVFNQNGAGIAAAEAERQRQQALLLAHRTEVERDVRLLAVERDRRTKIADHYAQTIVPVLREHRQLVERALSGMELDLTALLAAEDMVTQSGIEYLEARLAQQRADIALARALGRYGKNAPSEPR